MSAPETLPVQVAPPHADEALLAAAKASPEGVAQVYDAYADKLYGYLLKRCGHKETAEDIVSRVFMKFIESLPNIQWQGVSLGAWLYRAGSNALIDHWRSANVRLDADVDQETWDPAAPDPHVNDRLDIKFESDKVAHVMQQLCPRDQQVLDLRFFGGYEATEIALLMGISDNHAAVLVYRALGRLRAKYKTLYV